MTPSTPVEPASIDPQWILERRFAQAIARAFPQLEGPIDPAIAPSKRAATGDFQCNAAMALGKRLGMPPREVARAIVSAVDVSDLAEPVDEASIAGPGFINLKLRPGALAELLESMAGPDLGLPPVARPETVVVDLCGVNLAKQMHVGHIRSIVIGDAIARALERLGHRVVRQNHVGDWGLPIAMVVWALHERERAGLGSCQDLTLDDLDALYKAQQRRTSAGRAGLRIAQKWSMGPKVLAELEAEVADADEALECAKKALVALQSGQAWAVSLWERISAITMQACMEACRRLHARITLDDSAGESSYRQELGPMVQDLLDRGVAEVDDQAVVVRGEDQDPPAIIRKGDGGFLYATTDLAAIRRRVQQMGASRVVYCVDVRQSLHFRQVFAAARRAGYATIADGRQARLEHAAFGTILGPDGRPFKTRSGQSVRLGDLLDEAQQRAEAVVAEKSPQLDASERARTAEVVAIAAIKFADLANDRTRDYVFDFDRILAFEGDTGPYLLYALVRLRSLFREAAQRGVGDGWASATVRLEHPAEQQLALSLLRYPTVVRAVGQTLEPHRLSQHMLEVANRFSAFYQACKVLAAEDPATRDSRLKLCDLTARVLADGLDVLGLPTLERM